MKRISSHVPFLTVLALPVLVYHWRILFLGEILCGGDMISQFVPWREFALREIAQGRFPGWNPYVFCGTPFAANIQTSLFYPLNVLNAVFSVERSFSLSLVFHHALSLLTMYIFLVRLWGDRGGAVLGAMAYGWSGFFITHGHDGHLIHSRAYALLPLALYFQTLWRNDLQWKAVVFFAFSLAGLFYAGHTQIPLYAFYLLFFRAVGWGIQDFREQKIVRSLLRFPLWTLTGQALSLGLAAFVLLPLIQLSQQTASRAGGADYAFATSDSMPPQHIITLVAPFFYGDPTREIKEEQFWETRTGYHEICGYVGILPLLLFGLAFLSFSPQKQKRNGNKEQDRFERNETLFFAMVAGCGILFALGNFAPFYPILYYGLPGWSYFRVPGRLLLLFILGVSVLSAMGYRAWRKEDFAQAINHLSTKLLVVSSILFVIATIILAASKPALLDWLREFEIDRTITAFGLWSTRRSAISQQLPDLLFQTRYAWMLQSFLLACGWIVAGWLCLLFVKRVRSAYGWLIPALILLLDLFFFASRFTQTLPANQWRETYFPDSELISVLQNHHQGDRVLCLDDAIGYPILDFHPELRPNRLMHYGIRTVRGYDPIILRSYTRHVNRLFNQNPDAPQGGLLFFPSLPPHEDLNDMNVRLIVTAQTLPEPYRKIWQDQESKLTVYENPDCKPLVFLAINANSNELHIKSTASSWIEFDVALSEADQVVISQNAYPGWTLTEAHIDSSRSLWKETFPAFSIPAGTHSLKMRLNLFSLSGTSTFMLGGLLTGVSCLFCFLVCMRFSQR